MTSNGSRAATGKEASTPTGLAPRAKRERDRYRSPMAYDCILVDRDGPFVTITMNLPDKRNALSLVHMQELTQAFQEAGDSDALGVILAANGKVFSAGHDFADMAGADL